MPEPSLSWRVRRFWRISTREKYNSVMGRIYSKFSGIVVPVRLPFGMWWLARSDHISKPILEGTFENSEYNFVRRFLHPGMTMLDIGAHHGFYSLLSSSTVGSNGRVFSFEPSPRERKSLLRHVKINGCSNISVQPYAIGDQRGEASFFQADSSVSGCNSLRTPSVNSVATPITVQVVRLDDWIKEHEITQVDFIKLDIEGGELFGLRGAGQLLKRAPRPVVLVEVEDKRTQPWGYRARDTVSFLEERGYSWYGLSEQGDLTEIGPARENFDANLVAIPRELIEIVFNNLKLKH